MTGDVSAKTTYNCESLLLSPLNLHDITTRERFHQDLISLLRGATERYSSVPSLTKNERVPRAPSNRTLAAITLMVASKMKVAHGCQPCCNRCCAPNHVWLCSSCVPSLSVGESCISRSLMKALASCCKQRIRGCWKRPLGSHF